MKDLGFSLVSSDTVFLELGNVEIPVIHEALCAPF